MTAAKRVTPFRYVEIERLGTEIEACSDEQAEWFSTEEQQPDGRWLVLEDYATRAEAQAAIDSGAQL